VAGKDSDSELPNAIVPLELVADTPANAREEDSDNAPAAVAAENPVNPMVILLMSGAMMNKKAFIVPVVPVAVHWTAGHAVDVLAVSAFAVSMRFQNPVPLPPAVVLSVYPDAVDSAVVEFDAQKPATAWAFNAAGTSVPSVDVGDPALVVCLNWGAVVTAPEKLIIDTTKFTADDEKPQVCVAGSLAATFQYAPIVVKESPLTFVSAINVFHVAPVVGVVTVALSLPWQIAMRILPFGGAPPGHVIAPSGVENVPRVLESAYAIAIKRSPESPESE
jgi:hypothetical protein